MSITSIDIQEQGFGTARNGYDMQEVDVFLEHVAAELDQMQAEHRAEIEAIRADAAQQIAGSPDQAAEIRSLKEQILQLERQLAEQRTNEAVISEAFIAAQKSANQIKDNAKAEAEKIRGNAEAKAQEIVGAAASEKKRIIEEIDRLEKSRAAFVDQYSGLIKHFDDEAKRVFASAGLSPDTPVYDASIRATHEPVRDFSIESSYRTPDVSVAERFDYGETDSVDVDELD